MRTHALITALVALTIGLSSASAQTVKWDFEGDATQWIPSETDPNTTGVGVADASGNRQGKALEIAGAVPESFGASYIPWRDWRPYGTLKLQVYLPKDAPADIDCYVYLKDKQYLWYQTAPFHVPGDDEKRVPVKMGAWNSITVDISPQSTSWEPGGHLKSWHRALYLPREFGVRFFSPTEWEGAVQIDDVQLIELRADQRRDKPFGANEPAIQLERNADSVPCYEKFELTFQTDKEPDNPFDPECIDVQGHFRAPSGKVTHVPGFYYQDYSRLLNDDGFEKLIPVGEPCWKIRYSPREPGEHEYVVTLDEARGQLRSETEALTAEPPLDPRGLIRVSKTDPRYFEFENGEFYYPIGINMRDGGGRADKQKGTYAFDEFFPMFRDAGLSFVRTWMCAWWAGIEWTAKYDSRYDGIGRYSMYNAWRLDHELNLAEQNDLFLEVTFNSHGQLRRDKFDAEWMFNPYAAENGGPVATPSLFWTNPIAKKHYRNRYRYIAARWGYSQHIMSWDLWNEIDLVDAYGILLPHVAQWHDEMSTYLREVDPMDHLIVTHYCLHFSNDGGRSLWKLPNIDYVQSDAYWPDKHVGDDMSRGYGPRADIEKPYVVIEYGPQTSSIPGLTRAQIEASYRIGLWSSICMPMASPAQFWYNDIWERDNYIRHNLAAAKFIAGEDRRGQGWQWINHNPKNNPKVPVMTPSNLYVHAMKSPKATYFYAFDVERLNAGDASLESPPYQGAALDLKDIPNGDYDAEFWDPLTGDVVTTTSVSVADGNAHIILPDFTQDIVCKMRLR